MGGKAADKRRNESGSRNTIGQRLEWAIYNRQPKEGRSYGIRLFAKRMKARAEEIGEAGGPPLVGYALASIHGYVRDEVVPPLPFLEEAARLLSVRPEWLGFGQGAPTEEEEAARREGPEEELAQFSTVVYEALGVPTTIPAGTRTVRHPEGAPEEVERFWGPAPWSPIVRQTALRLYQHRPAWFHLTEEGPERPSTGPDADESWRQATEAVANALGAPLREFEIDAAHLELDVIADYVQAVSLALQRVITRYLPEPLEEEEDDAQEA